MIAALLLFAAAAAPVDTPAVAVRTMPEAVLLTRAHDQRLNFDFLVRNGTADTLELVSVEVSVYDAAGRLVLRRDMDGSGASPANRLLAPERVFAPGDSALVFNPFHAWDPALDLATLRYRLGFQGPGDVERSAEVEVRPRPYQPANALRLPVAGRLWVHHGNDFLAHHRRWNALHPIARMFGATRNFARYALDLVVVNEQGETRRTGARRNDDFYGWGQPVLAPAAGVVVAAYDDDMDDDLATGRGYFDPERLAAEPMHFYGNYVVVDHGGGEFSMLGHLQHGSVPVRAGDRVRAGDVVGRIGTSGSAEFHPHLHYELRGGTGMAVDGLPPYFHDFIRTGRSEPVDGLLETGEFVLDASPASARPR